MLLLGSFRPRAGLVEQLLFARGVWVFAWAAEGHVLQLNSSMNSSSLHHPNPCSSWVRGLMYAVGPELDKLANIWVLAFHSMMLASLKGWVITP